MRIWTRLRGLRLCLGHPLSFALVCMRIWTRLRGLRRAVQGFQEFPKRQYEDMDPFEGIKTLCTYQVNSVTSYLYEDMDPFEGIKTLGSIRVIAEPVCMRIWTRLRGLRHVHRDKKALVRHIV